MREYIASVSDLKYCSDFRILKEEYGDVYRSKKTSVARSSEATEQKVVLSWCKLQSGKFPQLKMIYHIPNEGKRSKRTGADLKLQGMKPGVPDLVLPVMSADGSYIGLYIEMKYGSNTVTKEQEEWLKALNKSGSYACVCYDADTAICVIKKYLGI